MIILLTFTSTPFYSPACGGYWAPRHLLNNYVFFNNLILKKRQIYLGLGVMLFPSAAVKQKAKEGLEHLGRAYLPKAIGKKLKNLLKRILFCFSLCYV
jgi:hypothetical protein